MPVMGFVASGYEHCGNEHVLPLPYGLLTQSLGLGGDASVVLLASANLLWVATATWWAGRSLVGSHYWLALGRERPNSRAIGVRRRAELVTQAAKRTNRPS